MSTQPGVNGAANGTYAHTNGMDATHPSLSSVSETTEPDDPRTPTTYAPEGQVQEGEKEGKLLQADDKMFGTPLTTAGEGFTTAPQTPSTDVEISESEGETAVPQSAAEDAGMADVAPPIPAKDVPQRRQPLDVPATSDITASSSPAPDALAPPTPAKDYTVLPKMMDFGPASQPLTETPLPALHLPPNDVGRSTTSLQDVPLRTPSHEVDAEKELPSSLSVEVQLPPRASVMREPSSTSTASRSSISSSPVMSTRMSMHTPQSRRPSMAASVTSQSSTVISAVPLSIISTLETISASREIRRSKDFQAAVQHALELTRSGHAAPSRSREIFEPLRMACETRNEKLQVVSIDCIAKLISYSFFIDTSPQPAELSPPPSPRGPESPSAAGRSPRQPYLADMITHTITSCHTESTPPSVSLQIVKALLALVLSSTLLVHHSSLLKAVRTVYNVFLLSGDSESQGVAQGGLTQMVLHVFARCRIPSTIERDDEDGAVTPTAETGSAFDSPAPASRSVTPAPKHTVEDAADGKVPLPEGQTPADGEDGGLILERESDASFEADAEASPAALPNGEANAEAEEEDEGKKKRVPPSLTLRMFENPNPNDQLPEADLTTGSSRQVTANDLFIKDAFLVFRALCKLTMKALGTDSERDLKSHAMRSKLLSLHLVLNILSSHMAIFVEPSVVIPSGSSSESTPFLQATKQYICLSLSRNAVSSVPQVFELSVEIFWRVLSGMRTKLKKEIEVLLHEIFIPILEMRNSTARQKSVVMSMLQRLCQEPQALVEIYLNYDCDRTALDNIYEHLMHIISRMSSTHIAPQANKPNEPISPNPAKPSKAMNGSAIPPSYSTAAVSHADDATSSVSETRLKRQSLECLVSVLRSLVTWGTALGGAPVPESKSRGSDETPSSGPESASLKTPSLERLGSNAEGRSSSSDLLDDDPGRFESAKHRKTALLEGIKRFNFKPKRGIEYLLENGFIRSKQPKDIATFLLHCEGLSKSMIGEYLGEGDEENVAIMHAFVDMLDFSNIPFVDALRVFLQSFRLPGEAQKIDRFMLKFAERYIAGSSQTPFANADTAYVLSYSTIMLNTDAHNPQVKVRMTKADFIRNNRGINDGADLPEEFLSAIYDDIQANEIRMKDEVEAAMVQALPSQGLANALANVGRDLQKEAYVLQSMGMSNRTEALFRNLMRNQRRSTPGGSDQFFSASNHIHVRPMFEVAWMPFLAGISGPLQDTDDLEVVLLCLEGFKHAIRIVCLFDLELERNVFVTTLAKFTFLNNLGEMKVKHMEAIKLLLEVATTDGIKDNLKGSWHEVLTCVSQLERMQFISDGRDGVEPGRKGSATKRSTLQRTKKPAEELAHASRSTQITVSADMVFSWSEKLNGSAILDYVKALCDVSSEEIQPSSASDRPRLFSLQKLVEISYYNMNRIRIEWSNLWVILGEHFNQVCCSNNPDIAIFGLDALRQLAMRFLEKEELPHFRFQKDFLKPFEYTMVHNPNPDVRELVLQCLHQMIQARVGNMRSGWRTMFGVFSAASKVLNERVVTYAFELVSQLYSEQFAVIVVNGAFADLTVCMTDFCKVSKFQKISLLAINILRGVIPTMLKTPECFSVDAVDGVSNLSTTEDPMVRFWFPVLFSFYDIIMNGEDLEVRRLALDSLFSALKTYGSTFPVEFWDMVCQELLFPIFAVLRSSQDLSRFSTQEDMSVWLSTTMIQALRDLIDLYTYYFDTLERTLDGLLELLCVCICQENDTLARIGTSCFQQLLEQNVHKLSPHRWERVITTFVKLFKTTTPYQLLDESLRADLDEPNGTDVTAESPTPNMVPAPLSPDQGQRPPAGVENTASVRKHVFKQIIVKCVLQLLLIETTDELLQNDDVYNTIPPEHLLRLMAVLDQSYQFARDFNADEELRKGLWKAGFMKHLPNLLKQESSSAATLVKVLLRMYSDERVEKQGNRQRVSERLIPLCLGILKDFNSLRASKQSKNIITWSPIVAEVLQGFAKFDDADFSLYLSALYPLVTELLSRELVSDVRESLRVVFYRVGVVQGIIEQ